MASYLLPVQWVAVSLSVSAEMNATASASCGLIFVVLGGSDNHVFCKMALVIASAGDSVIFGGSCVNNNNRLGGSSVAAAILAITALPFCGSSRCLVAFFNNRLCGEVTL